LLQIPSKVRAEVAGQTLALDQKNIPTPPGMQFRSRRESFPRRTFTEHVEHRRQFESASLSEPPERGLVDLEEKGDAVLEFSVTSASSCSNLPSAVPTAD
jgi:hypothetical protein